MKKFYNHRQRIQEILDSDYNTKEKIKINGEVFTPFSLIDEMLDKLPKDSWTNPNKTWLDPAAGLGNFHAVVVERLMEGLKEQIPDEKERYKHIVEKQLYFIELNPESVKLIKQIFDPNNEYKMNLVCADALDKDHSGWDEVGYMWDERDILRRQAKKEKQIEIEFYERVTGGKSEIPAVNIYEGVEFEEEDKLYKETLAEQRKNIKIKINKLMVDEE